MPKIVIDPKCIGLSVNSIPFDDVILNLSNSVRSYLAQVLPAENIIMTRTSSSVCPLDNATRVAIANQSDVSAVISIGVDVNADNPTYNGMIVYTSGTAERLNFATAIINGTADLRTKWNLGLPYTAPQPSTAFRMVTDVPTNVPSAVIMAGLISNTNDVDILVNYNFQKDFGFYVAKSIAAYLGLGTIVQSEITEPQIMNPPPIIPEAFKAYMPWIIGGLFGITALAIIVSLGKKER